MSFNSCLFDGAKIGTLKKKIGLSLLAQSRKRITVLFGASVSSMSAITCFTLVGTSCLRVPLKIIK